MLELTIKIKDTDASFSEEHLIYEDFLLSEDNPVLQEMVKEAIKKINFELQDPKITIRTFMQWQ